MPIGIVIDGDKELHSRLARMIREQDATARLVVGYAAENALYVHENREQKLKGQPRPSGIGVYWGPRGRPGFLLDVAREMRRELADFAAAQLRRGIRLSIVLYWVGRRLMKESQRNVPVEHEDLRDSAFVRVE